jgi:hypothetical protein
MTKGASRVNHEAAFGKNLRRLARHEPQEEREAQK